MDSDLKHLGQFLETNAGLWACQLEDLSHSCAQAEEILKDQQSKLLAVELEWTRDSDGFSEIQLRDNILGNQQTAINLRTDILNHLRTLQDAYRMLQRGREFRKTCQFSKALDCLDDMRKIVDPMLDMDGVKINVLNSLLEERDAEIEMARNEAVELVDSVISTGHGKITVNPCWNAEMMECLEKLGIWEQAMRLPLSRIINHACTSMQDSDALDINQHGNTVELANRVCNDVDPKWNLGRLEQRIRGVTSMLDSLKSVLTVLDHGFDARLWTLFWKMGHSKLVFAMVHHVGYYTLPLDKQEQHHYHPGGKGYSALLELEHLVQAESNMHTDGFSQMLGQIERKIEEMFMDQCTKFLRNVLLNSNRGLISASDIEYPIEKEFVALISRDENIALLLEEDEAESVYEPNRSSPSIQTIGMIHQHIQQFIECLVHGIHLVISNRMDNPVSTIHRLIDTGVQIFLKFQDRKDASLLYSDSKYVSWGLVFAVQHKLWTLGIDMDEIVPRISSKAVELRTIGNEHLNGQTSIKKQAVKTILHDLDTAALLDHDQSQNLMRTVHNLTRDYSRQLETLPRGAYLRNTGVIYDYIISHLATSIMALSAIGQENGHWIHAMGVSISTWARELFEPTEMVMFEDLDNNHGLQRLDQMASYLPHWMQFQHLLKLLEWDLEFAIEHTLTHTESPVHDGWSWSGHSDSCSTSQFLLPREQIVSILEARFGRMRNIQTRLEN